MALLIFVGVGLWYRLCPRPAPTIQVRISRLPQSQMPTKSEVLSSAAAHDLPKPEVASLDRKEVLLDKAVQIARIMLESLHDRRAAGPAFQWLVTCSRAPDTDDTERALCAANAKRLAVRFPDEFSREFASVERELPDAVRTFLKSVTP